MSQEEMYKKFRLDLEEYAIPLMLENVDYYDLKYENKIVGFYCLEDTYLDAFYILPEYRRKKIGSKLVKEVYKKHNFKTLHIINNNIPALNFWKKNFKLRKKAINFCDTFYEIEDIRNE